MTTFIKFFSISISVVLALCTPLYAAHMYIEVPETASSNRVPLTLTVYLDTDDDTVSGLSGDLSFPSDLFDVSTISAYNGIVPLWAEQPKVSLEKRFDRRTHITFEGVIPGGFSGVRAPYGKDIYPGILFTVTLIPRNAGSGTFTLNPVEVHAYDDKGTIIASPSDEKKITVPPLSGDIHEDVPVKYPRSNNTVVMNVSMSELIDDHNAYVYIHDEDPSHVIDHIEIAESNEYDSLSVPLHLWHTVSNPHVLSYSSRNHYLHAKIVYTDNTYTFKTVTPVENSQSLLKLSRILVYILITLSLLYHYGKNYLHIFSRSSKKNV